MNQIERLQAALDLAISTIESYQMDLRNSEDLIGIDLEAIGFCQGVIYTDAIRMIRKLAQLPPEVIPARPALTPPRPSYTLAEPDINNLPVLTACPECTATPAFNRLLFGFIVICPYCHRRTEAYQSVEDAAADWNGTSETTSNPGA